MSVDAVTATGKAEPDRETLEFELVPLAVLPPVFET